MENRVQVALWAKGHKIRMTHCFPYFNWPFLTECIIRLQITIPDTFFFNIQLGVNIVFRHFFMQFQENHQQMSVWNQQRQQTSGSHGYVQTVTNTTQPLDSLFLTNSTAATKQKLLQWTGRQDTSSLVDLKSSQTTRYTCPVSPWEESVWQLNKCLYEHWRTVSGRNVVIYVCSIYFFVSGTEIF